jgi:oxygen-independent coproporphyrinogen-3 oxidase
MSATIELPVETQVGNYFVSNYPPYSCWNGSQVPGFLEALDRPAASPDLGLYVHLPFCRQRCSYCYFRVHVRPATDDVDLYIRSLLEELSLVRAHTALANRQLTSAYFGGGSPSYLTEGQIRTLLGGLQEQMAWDKLEECTFECDPGSTTKEKLQALRESGVTRLSLGFQSMNREALHAVGRALEPSDSIRAYHLAREAGFDEINIDLLAGLPGETQKSWMRSIAEVAALEPDCVTIYQLELTHNSALQGAIGSGRSVELATWPEKREMVGAAFRYLEDAGYTIGSGYMAIRDPSTWRFVYTVGSVWQGRDFVALGESSFGHLQGYHYQNLDLFDRYVAAVAEGKLPVSRALRITDEERLRREFILLLKTGTIDAGYFRGKFGVEIGEYFAEQLGELKARDMLNIDGDFIRLTRPALLQVDWLLPRFYLPQHQGIRYT